MGLMVSGCDRSIDAIEASRLLLEGGIAGKPVLCPTPLERRGFKQWFWTGQRLPSGRLAYGSSAEQCVLTVRDHGIARVVSTTDDGEPLSCLTNNDITIVPIAGLTEVHDGALLVRCGAMQITVLDVHAKGDIATIQYREDAIVDEDLVAKLSACKPGLPSMDTRPREVRAYHDWGQWFLER